MYLGISDKDYLNKTSYLRNSNINSKKNMQKIYQKENKSIRCSAPDAL